MNKLLVVIMLLVAGGLGVAVVKRVAFSSGRPVFEANQSDNLKRFQGEWYAASIGDGRAASAYFKGCSLRLVGGTHWRKTLTVDGLDQRGEKSLLVVDGGDDALVYRFESDDVLWMEIEPDAQSARKSIRFERVIHPD